MFDKLIDFSEKCGKAFSKFKKILPDLLICGGLTTAGICFHPIIPAVITTLGVYYNGKVKEYRNNNPKSKSFINIKKINTQADIDKNLSRLKKQKIKDLIFLNLCDGLTSLSKIGTIAFTTFALLNPEHFVTAAVLLGIHIVTGQAEVYFDHRIDCIEYDMTTLVNKKAMLNNNQTNTNNNQTKSKKKKKKKNKGNKTNTNTNGNTNTTKSPNGNTNGNTNTTKSPNGNTNGNTNTTKSSNSNTNSNASNSSNTNTNSNASNRTTLNSSSRVANSNSGNTSSLNIDFTSNSSNNSRITDDNGGYPDTISRDRIERILYGTTKTNSSSTKNKSDYEKAIELYLDSLEHGSTCKAIQKYKK